MATLTRGPFYGGPQGGPQEPAPGNPEAGPEAKDWGIRIHEVSKQVISDCEPIPCTSGISGGVVCTGFIDVEKIIYPGYHKPPVFLEKKLPFQILLLTLESRVLGPGAPDALS